MIAFAALSGPLPKAGVFAVAALAALALTAGTAKLRAWAMAGALVLAPVLLLADIWNSPQLRLVHRHPLPAALGALVALGLLSALAVLIVRRPSALALLAVAALPFRIPIQAGGVTSNLLVPLYLVVAAGSLAYTVPAVRSTDDPDERPSARLGQRLLALYIVLYAAQSIYSADFEKALQQMVFFYVPFALLFVLLTQLDWTPRLIKHCFTLARRARGRVRRRSASSSTRPRRSSSTRSWSWPTISTRTSPSTRCSSIRTSSGASWRW